MRVTVIRKKKKRRGCPLLNYSSSSVLVDVLFKRAMAIFLSPDLAQL